MCHVAAADDKMLIKVFGCSLDVAAAADYITACLGFSSYRQQPGW
jgi:hypothetical protein